MCLFIILLFAGPRTAIVLWWLVQQDRWDSTFDSFLVPFLGFLFLPWTTVMYVLVGPGGVNGLDFLWMGLAVLADLASLAGGGRYGRQRRAAT